MHQSLWQIGMTAYMHVRDCIEYKETHPDDTGTP